MTETEDRARAFARLQQLAREEKAAAEAGDVATLCRIASLIPSTMERLGQAQLENNSEIQAAVQEIQAAHSTAEAVLTQKMKDVAAMLKQYACIRRIMNGYARSVASKSNRLEGIEV